MAKVMLIFLDGVGMGDSSPQNPFFSAPADYLPFYPGGTLPDNTPVKPIDPLLGIDGLPQSATGQTSLFTGKNIPKMLNEHRGSFPNKQMRKIIKQGNLLSNLRAKMYKVVFMNAYPVYTHFFTSKHVDISDEGDFTFSSQFPPRFKKRISVSTCMMICSGLIPFSLQDILNKKAIYQDFSNHLLIKAGLEVQEFSPRDAANILLNKLPENDFIFYEYFLTDLFGHRKTFKENINLIQNLNALLKHLVLSLNPKTTTLILTSDHGNMEDSSTKTHTTNPVPLLVWGKNSHQYRESINSITDVTPAILEKFG